MSGEVVKTCVIHKRVELMKNFVKNNISPILWLWLAYIILLLYLQYDTAFETVRLTAIWISKKWTLHFIFYSVVGILFDSLFFTIITLLCAKISTKFISPVIGFIVLIFCATHAIYFRYFNCYIDISLFSEVTSIESRSDSFFSLIQIKDVVAWAIFVVLFIIGLVSFNKHEKTIGGYCLRKLAVLFVPILAINVFLLVRDIDWDFAKTHTHRWDGEYKAANLRNEYGLCYGVINLAISDILTSVNCRELTENDKNILNQYQREEYLCDKNAPKNVILIILESLQVDALVRCVDGLSVMPRLKDIANGGGYQRVTTFEHSGVSSDGQLILMTGILPHTTKVVANSYNKNKMYGLGTLLKEKGLHSSIIIPNPANAWNADKMYDAYGIEHIIEANVKDRTFSTDQEVFSVAKNTIREFADNPFFLTIVTISTHMPYNEPFNLALTHYNCDSIPSEYLTYLEKCNYLDYYIGDFFDFLQEESLLDNTLVVMCSDHKAPLDYKKCPISLDTPLIIISPEEYTFSRVNINQQDIYPTILDIMQVRNDEGWRGIGYSLFAPDSIPQMSLDSQQIMSNIILETDYFSRQE